MHLFFLVLPLLFLNVCSPLHAQLAGYQPISPEKTLEFTFQDKDGLEHSFDEFKGKIVLVNFWAPFCGPCVKELPSINRLAETFKPDELAILPICTSLEYKEQALSAIHLGDLSHLNLYFDHTQALKSALNARGIPLTIILDKEGKIIGRLDGATEWDHFENIELINDLVAGRGPQPRSWYDRIMGWVQK